MAGEPTRTTSPEQGGLVTVPDGGEDVDAPAVLSHFELGAQLGGGGMGVVFKARDTVLDRTVALKLVRPDNRLRGDKSRQRLLREAQALARLKHPNVVTVFEVGLARDEIFIAMELVEGATLREWMREPREWPAIVDLFLGVGRGLAAAHALGLVHRDVKPSNVFLDRDGTPKVGDFGLVAWAGALDDDRTDPGAISSPLERTLTTTGSVMGTPAYMAPEQLAGDRADARADQFAFCASLYEALSGKLPGARDARPMPRKLEPIIARGMSPRPDDRYPSMDALLIALARVRRGNRPVWLALGGAGAAIAIAAGAWTVARSRVADDDPCPEPTAAIAPVWGGARKAALHDHVVAVDKAQGASRAALIEGRIDPWVHGWSDMRVDACRATRMRGAQSDTMLDLRMRCLDRRLEELDDAISLVAGATTPATLDKTIVGLTALSPIDTCADTAALGAAAPPPDRPDQRAKADALAREIDRIEASSRGGQLEGLSERATRVAADARALGHAPTLAAALTAEARVEINLGKSDTTIAILRELTQVAARAHDDRDEAFAWTKLIGVTASDLSQPDEALALEPAASAAVLRAGEPIDLRVGLLHVLGEILDDGPHPEQGLAKLDEARKLLESAGGTDPHSEYASQYADIIFETASAKDATGDLDGAIAGYHRSISINQALFGPDNDSEAYSWHNLGETLRLAGRLDEAADAFATAVRIREARLGPSPSLAVSVQGLATTRGDQRRWPESLALYDRAVAMQQATMTPDDPRLGAAMMGRAMAMDHSGRRDEARTAYGEIIAMFERTHAHTVNLPITYFNRAELASVQGRCPDAIADDDRAIALFEEMKGKDSSLLAYPLGGKGRCQILEGHPADALPTLERALALPARGGDANTQALAHFYHGRALVETGRDRAGGMAEARRARTALDGGDPGLIHEVDSWLNKQR